MRLRGDEMNIVLRTNAIPVYGFLSIITARRPEGETQPYGKILDCGAGGPVPPLALFHAHGFEAWGIDASEAQLERAKQFCEERGMQIHLRQGDMRDIPFADNTFDYVYEHYSMCHLSKRDTTLAVSEMYRVVKRGGLCLLGVISNDTWPRSFLGEEREPGEYWGEEAGEEETLHSMFSDEEADKLVAAWEVVSKEKRVLYLRKAAEEMTLEAWRGLRGEAGEACTWEDWSARYASRTNALQYAHLCFVLSKS
jgi:ubiquinone/menaquinone biosynthesis C-methylase UbiE